MGQELQEVSWDLSPFPLPHLFLSSLAVPGRIWGEQFLAGRIKSILLLAVFVPHHVTLRGQCPQHTQPGVLPSPCGVQGSLSASHELGQGNPGVLCSTMAWGRREIGPGGKNCYPRGFWSAWRGKRPAQRWRVTANWSQEHLWKDMGNTGFYPQAEVVSLEYHKERGTQPQIIWLNDCHHKIFKYNMSQLLWWLPYLPALPALSCSS